MASFNSPSKSTNITDKPKKRLFDLWFKADNTLSSNGDIFFCDQKTIGSFLSKTGLEKLVMPVLKDRLCKESEFIKKWDACFKTRDLDQLPITRDYFEFCIDNEIPIGFEGQYEAMCHELEKMIGIPPGYEVKNVVDIIPGAETGPPIQEHWNDKGDVDDPDIQVLAATTATTDVIGDDYDRFSE